MSAYKIQNTSANARHLPSAFLLVGPVAGCFVALAAQAADETSPQTDSGFGRRVGVEQIGLYNEGQARGFDLGTSNAFRIEDAYYVRAGTLSDTILDNVAVKLGVAAARSPLPSPTGVVNYSLKRADSDRTTITTGLRENQSPYIEGEVRRRSADGRQGWVFDTLLQPDLTYGDGTRGWNAELGTVYRVEFASGSELSAFASFDDSRSGGPYEVIPSAGLPPIVHHHPTLGAPIATFAGTIANGGILLRTRVSDAVQLHASVLRSDYRQNVFDDTLLQARSHDRYEASLLRLPPTSTRSDAAELAADWAGGSTALGHQVTAGFRARRSEVISSDGSLFSLGSINPEQPAYPDLSDLKPTSLHQSDTTLQDALFTRYTLLVGDSLEARAGVSAVRQLRTVIDPQGGASFDHSFRQAPFASLVWAPVAGWTVFADIVQGLEDSGAAPPTATNRNQPLAPVEARQSEVGLSRRQTGGLGVDMNLFDIEKSIAGFDSTGAYRLLAPARHRGAEVSWSLGSDADASVLAGLTVFRARLADGARRPGIAERIAFTQLKYRISAPLVLDTVLSWQAGACIDPACALRTQPLKNVDVGARYEFGLARHAAQLRATVVNAFDSRAWVTSTAGSLFRPQSQTFRLALSVELDANRN